MSYDQASASQITREGVMAKRLNMAFASEVRLRLDGFLDTLPPVDMNRKR